MTGGQCWTKKGQPKKRYATRRAAKQARRDLIAMLGADPGAPYRCHECDWFHLGHYPTNRSIREALRARHRRGAA